MQPHPLPTEFIHDSVESHVASFSGRSRAVYLVLLATLATAVAALPLVRVSLSVQGRGLIRPAKEKHEIRVPAAGLVEEIRIRSGQRLRPGDTLLVLRTTAIRGRVERLHERETEARREVADLEQLTRGTSSPRPGALLVPRHRQSQAQLAHELQLGRLRQERASRELARARSLFERGLAPRADLQTLEFQVEELRSQERVLLERYRQGWEAELATGLERLRELRSELRQLAEETGRHTILSPVTGTLEEHPGLSPGSFVQAGERVAVVSPTTRLLAEVYVAPDDIGLLREGMPVRLQIDAFHYTDWGFITGRIVEIPSDFVLAEQRPLFRIRVRPDRSWLTLKNGLRGELRKGMTLTAHFPVAERSLWQLLRDDVNDWLNPSQARWDEPGRGSRAPTPS